MPRFPFLAVLAVLLAGGIGHRWVNALLLAADAAPAPLRAPLASLPMRLGGWEGTDVPMDARVLEVAGNDDQVYRRYVNAAEGQALDVYLAYAARPVKMIGHRPDVCYPAHGWQLVDSRRETLTLAGGEQVPCLVHRFTRDQPAPAEVAVLNFYVLRGRYLTDWKEFWGPGWRLPNLSRDPSFYVAQVQISASVAGLSGLGRIEPALRTMAATVATELSAMLPAASPGVEPPSRR